MTATVLDDRRRLVLPMEFPARSAVTIQHIDEDTILVKRQREQTDMVLIAVPIIKDLKSDPDWEKIESRMVAHNNRNLAPFEE